MQQLRLARKRKLTNLVQEDRSRVRRLKFALLPAVRARECTAFVAEQLALREIFRNRPAVHNDEGPGGTPAVVMNRPRHPFTRYFLRAMTQETTAIISSV